LYSIICFHRILQYENSNQYSFYTWRPKSRNSITRTSSFIIHHSSFIIHHSSFIIHHSSFIINHLSLTTPTLALIEMVTPQLASEGGF
ncbi:hypothetical protein, partial [uncultured Chryseobacterium sp.]|uniref:hypothetical protein n=1 Tax=uncultured Chryseobacterium sp. TaxID=259322 RepID=UPI0025887AD7